MNAEFNLLALPDDMIIAIVAHLDVLSIIALKQTCWQLYALSKAHAVWCNALSLFREDCPEVPCQLEGPIGFYSSQDLESFVVRLERLYHNWTDPDPPQNSYRLKVLNYSEEAHETLKILIPGGRWLLAFTSGRSGKGKVFAFDLEAPSEDTAISGTLLMTLRGVQRFTAVTYCIREDEPILTFDLAIVYQLRYLPPPMEIEGRLSPWRQVTTQMVIYRVTLEGPSHTNSKLRATCLQTMDLSPEHRRATSLYGNLIAIDRREETNPDDAISRRGGIDVLDWTRCSDTASVGATFRCSLLSEGPGTLPFSLRLASPQRLLVAVGDAIAVYEVPGLEQTDCKVAFLPDVFQSDILTPILVLYPSANRCIAVSPPIPFTIKPKDQVILVAHPTMIHLVRIPSDDLSKPTSTRWIYTGHEADFCILGRTRAAWTQDVISFQTRTWSLASIEALGAMLSFNVTSRKMMDPPGPETFNQSVLFDEVSGRMVFGQPKGLSMHTLIVEFA